MNILLTNDDGISSPGLAALARALSDHSLWMVAPHTCRSAGSMSLTLGRGMKLTPYDHPFVQHAYSLEGTSVDCVKLALAGDLGIPTPDVVVSGINLGLNVSRDLHYSATVGAAIEAVLSLIPAIAISAECDDAKECRLDDAASLLKDHFETIYGRLTSAEPRTFANINVPLTPFTQMCETKAAWDLVYDDCYKNDNNTYELVGPRSVSMRDTSTDLGAINTGSASISYLRPRWN